MMKEFHLGDVLSVTTGLLVSPSHIQGVYNILNYMTGHDLFTHQLPRASEKCKPFLFKQFPQLKNITGEEVNKENWKQWLDEQVEKYGESFNVEPMPQGEYKAMNPVSEFIEMKQSM